MIKTLDQLRRDAKALKSAYESGDAEARARVSARPPRGDDLKHADFLHVVARENTFSSWPALKEAFEALGHDRATKRQRLRIAIHNQQTGMVQRLLSEDPALGDGDPALMAALYDVDGMAAALSQTPGLATDPDRPWPLFASLALSPVWRIWPERRTDMIAMAELLHRHGADLNETAPKFEEPAAPVLYWALGHGQNIELGRWMLERGADPNDNESLYHATEVTGTQVLEMVLEFGARPGGTNALLRAIDFDDPAKVRLLLKAGADPNEFNAASVGGEEPWVIPALHQAARRWAGPEVVDLLLEAGADPARLHDGKSAYAYACVFGNDYLRQRIEALGQAPALSREDALLAKAARGEETSGQFVDPDKLSDEFRHILGLLIGKPGSLEHCRRLVEIGVEYDLPDRHGGVTPLQIAGWEGLPEHLSWMISLGPDLAHENNYGGNLFATILHGSGNCPDRAQRDHLGCMRVIMEHGVALPRRGITFGGDAAIADFLADWAARYPGQVVEHGFG